MPETSTLSTRLTEELNSAPTDASLAILFPGQGSHRVGAGRDLYEGSPLAREVFRSCEDAVNMPLSQLCFAGPEEALRDTANSQPAILAISLACLAAGLESGVFRRGPALMAGHSLGEFTALIAAGAIALEDGARLVATRGRLMAEAANKRPGTMVALVGLSEDALEDVCRESDVEPCNYNSPSQVVVGGPIESVETASALAKERGGRALPLSVSGAFHTSLMESAADEFANAADACPIANPSIPVIANSSAEPLTTVAAIRRELREQITRPVLWHQTMRKMMSAGVNTFIEAGPGRVLTGLVKRAGEGLTPLSLDSAASLESLRNV